MPVGTQRGIATWSPAGIYMQYARYGKNFFRFAASTLWNSLPDHFRTENSFSQFKSLSQSWNGSKCRCFSCRWLKFCFWFAYIFLFFILFNYFVFLVRLDNFIFFDFLVRQCCFYWLCWYQFFFKVFSIIIIVFLPAASFLNAALCWSICVWILNKSPNRHLPFGFLFRSIHSPPVYVCMS